MSDEVDLNWASNVARERADAEIMRCYRPAFRDSMQAELQWYRAFRREFDALTKAAQPEREDR